MTDLAADPCARADGLAGATFNYLVPAPNGRHAFINGDTGIATIEFR